MKFFDKIWKLPLIFFASNIYMKIFLTFFDLEFCWFCIFLNETFFWWKIMIVQEKKNLRKTWKTSGWQQDI